MTAVEVCFRYGNTPGEGAMRGLDHLCDVYGIRRVRLNEKEATISIEYDSTHLSESWVMALLRRAGIDLTEKLQLV